MSKPPSYASRVSQSRMDQIDNLCRKKPMTQLQLATELGIANSRTYDYVKFMAANKWIEQKDGIIISYISTKSFVKKVHLKPIIRKPHNRPIDSPCRSAPNVKPFRCEWTALFFGPGNRV